MINEKFHGYGLYIFFNCSPFVLASLITTKGYFFISVLYKKDHDVLKKKNEIYVQNIKSILHHTGLFTSELYILLYLYVVSFFLVTKYINV